MRTAIDSHVAVEDPVAHSKREAADVGHHGSPEKRGLKELVLGSSAQRGQPSEEPGGGRKTEWFLKASPSRVRRLRVPRHRVAPSGHRLALSHVKTPSRSLRGLQIGLVSLS